MIEDNGYSFAKINNNAYTRFHKRCKIQQAVRARIIYHDLVLQVLSVSNYSNKGEFTHCHANGILEFPRSKPDEEIYIAAFWTFFWIPM
ncbi:MAG: hypothetical protein KAH18_12400 [Psychromonas sp.]|nr:hypothetical protein [Psychromonas sp.]